MIAKKRSESSKVGDLVWLHCPARGKSYKLHRPWKGPFVIKYIFSDVVFRIQHRGPPRKCLVVHFNCLKPYLLCGRDAQERTEQLSKQKDDKQDPSSMDKEVREAASPDSDTEVGKVIIKKEHQDELDDLEEHQDELDDLNSKCACVTTVHEETNYRCVETETTSYYALSFACVRLLMSMYNSIAASLYCRLSSHKCSGVASVRS